VATLSCGRGSGLPPAPAGMRCPVSLSRAVPSHGRAGSHAGMPNYPAEPVTEYAVKKYILLSVCMGYS